MSEISKAYEPQSVEDKWYQFWLDRKFFVADAKSPKPAYSIVIPPPNITGVLHIGHVLNSTIQDILCRKARMDGKEVLWLPGTDHAGISTQNAVEKTLRKSGEMRHRDDFGREKLVEKIWQWKEKHGGIIIQQLKKLGASCDWTRERFTMDPEYSRCVQRVFVELFKSERIYRGKRMVNWCPASQTALSDEEVVMKEQKGFLYYFSVEVVEKNGTNVLGDDGKPIFLTIATTRPETIPGDTAVAVNPIDPRFAKFINKYVVRPLPTEISREQKLIPIIPAEQVDFEFGTGVLKVTPFHDKVDFEIHKGHGYRRLKYPELNEIEMPIEVIGTNDVMTNKAGQLLAGLHWSKARKLAVEKLAEIGLLVKEEPYTNNVGFSERADVQIQQRLSEQWFLRYPSAEKAREVVASGKMKFHPERWAKVYDHWMNGLQDWCVSRQLWWGHRIPVWVREIPLGENLPEQLNSQLDSDLAEAFNTASKMSSGFEELSVGESSSDRIVIGNIYIREKNRQLEALTYSQAGIKKLEENGFTQDPDVLDTWFSSWLWPFATMGWPTPTDTLKKFYPTTDLVTGPDIIFFWVARMIMAGYEYMGDPKFGLPDAMPFQNVYFTGIIRDKQGRKMSKSLGNSPDPLDLIAKFGADALRFGVMRAAPLGQDILFDEQNVELGRNFCNKLWNACRFRQMQGGGGSATSQIQGEIEPTLLSSDDKWILLKLDAAIREVTIALNEYKFSDATATLYRFFWSEYCDWYVEASKAVLQSSDVARKTNTLAVIDFVLSHLLRLFHPFLPFITEELWHGMGYSGDLPENQGGKTIMFAPWPKPLDDDFKGHYGLDDCYLEMVDAKYDLVSQGRNLRRNANIPSGKKIKFIFKPSNFMPPHDIEILRILLNAEAVEVGENFQPEKNVPAVRHELGELFLPLEGLIDVEAEKARLKKETEKYEAEIGKVQSKLNNPNFTQKVPPQVLEENNKRLVEWQDKLSYAKAALDALNG